MMNLEQAGMLILSDQLPACKVNFYMYRVKKYQKLPLDVQEKAELHSAYLMTMYRTLSTDHFLIPADFI